MRIYSLIVLLVIPLALRSCQPQGLPTAIDLVRGREVVTDSSDVIRKQGGYQGILIIIDDPDTGHGQRMKNIITASTFYGGDIIKADIGIPEKNIAFFPFFPNTLKKFPKSLIQEARVMHIPLFVPFREEQTLYTEKENILFVAAAGNTYSANDDRDLWNVEHSYWQGDNMAKYDNAFVSLNAGRTIMATSATTTEEGDIIPSELVVQCGDIAEWCFTVLPESYTSGASARLAAMAFYLAQLYPTAEEIVETMNVCAIDIGEPGIDREFGRGLANIVCAPVFEKELEAAMQVSSVTAHSPTLERMLASSKEDCGCVSLFSSVSHGFGTTVGHVGMSLSGGITVLAGTGFAPIGVESTLFSETNLFTEIGYKRSLFKKRDHRAWHKSMS